MKTKLSFLLILFAISLLTTGQETNNTNTENRFSVFVESPLFFKMWNNENANIGLINFEYLQKRTNSFSNSYSIGLVALIHYENEWYAPDAPVINLQYNAVFGRKNNFFETGIGLTVPVFLLNLRFGYRLNIGKRLLFKIAYTPTIYLEKHIDTEEYSPYTGYNGISVSLGYRFGIHISNETWNTKFNWLYGLQFDFQPFFQNYKGGKGYNGNLFLEILIHKTEKLRLTSGLGFGYGNAKYAYNSIPFGVSLLYGRNKHFLETGIKSVWIPIGGNSDGTFFTLQPELGYRIHLWKHFMARVAYTPYWWLSDKKGREYIEKKFVNCITVGVGVRFH
jgi:hypothetical protein